MNRLQPVRLVSFVTTDLAGITRGRSLPLATLEEQLASGCGCPAGPDRQFAGDLIVSSPVESASPFDSLVPAMAQVEALVATLVARMGAPLDERLEGIDQLRNAFSSHLLEE